MIEFRVSLSTNQLLNAFKILFIWNLEIGICNLYDSTNQLFYFFIAICVLRFGASYSCPCCSTIRGLRFLGLIFSWSKPLP